MEYDKIKQLMEDMGNSKLTSIDIDFPDGTKISMKKEKEQVLVKDDSSVHNINESHKQDNNISNLQTNESVELNKEDGNIVKSPMVGTFYIKPAPNAEPYVEIDKNVKKGDTLCIIEAMKLMNEIESEYTGKVVEIFVKDGSPVEYGTPLFKIC